MDAKKNLVLGLAKGYNWYIVEPFVRSFIKNVSNADMVLFMENYSDFTRFQLEQVKDKPFGGKIIIEPVPSELNSMHPANSRWKIFADYIKNLDDKYEQILVSDTRDVIFQGNVFECFKDQKNYLCYAEDFGDVGGKICCGVHDWIEEGFGKEEAAKMDDKNCICPGTVIGTATEMQIFAQAMWDNIPAGADFYGLDQALQIYIVYNDLVSVKNEIFSDCCSGDILSSEWFHTLNSIKVDGENILRGDGKIPALVHQYDKHPETTKFVNEVHRDLNHRFDERFSDLNSLTDQLPHLIAGNNLNDILKVFTSYLLNKNDFAGCGNSFADYWQTLLYRNNSDIKSEILELAFQRVIMSAFSAGFYVNQAKILVRCLELCKKNNRALIADFEDWLKARIIQMAKFHVEHGNFFRYAMCLNLMSRVNLTDNKYFYLLQAEICRKINRKDYAAENYKIASSYEEDTEKILNDYKAEMRSTLSGKFRI